MAKGDAEFKKAQEALVLDFLQDRAAEVDRQQGIQRARTLTASAARERLFLNQLEDALGKIMSRKYFPGRDYKPEKWKKSPTQRVLNLMLSDLHFGAMLDKREVPHQYGPVEEARRIAKVAAVAAEFKRQYREETELRVHLLGDIIQNQLHDPRDGQPLTWQAAAAMHLLTQAFVFLAAEFKKVTICCTPGNHGRNTARHPERATTQKWDSIETIIYSGIKSALAHLPNVSVEIPMTPYYTYDVFGMSGFMTHGDTVINPGYPGKKVEVGNVKGQINEINAKLEQKERHRIFGVGHVHVLSWVKFPNGVYFVSNGPLIPPDAYALSIGITQTACCQALWESVPGRMVGHRFEADVDEYTDKDKVLDKIVKPFTAF